MKNAIVLASLAVLGCVMGGCPLGNSKTTVDLVNSTSFPIEVTIYYGDNQDVLGAALPLTGTQVVETVPANSSVTFARDCDALQAIVIDRADLQIVGSIGPGQDTRVYRDGSDFGCGDRLTFTFSTSNFLTELDIAFDSTGS